MWIQSFAFMYSHFFFCVSFFLHFFLYFFTLSHSLPFSFCYSAVHFSWPIFDFLYGIRIFLESLWIHHMYDVENKICLTKSSQISVKNQQSNEMIANEKHLICTLANISLVHTYVLSLRLSFTQCIYVSFSISSFFSRTLSLSLKRWI